MAVRIRLSRTGRNKVATYRVVVADSRSPRDGRFLDIVGRYDPRPNPSIVEIDNEKAVGWLKNGAQPSDAVRKLLEISGALEEFAKQSAGASTKAKATPKKSAKGSKASGSAGGGATQKTKKTSEK